MLVTVWSRVGLLVFKEGAKCPRSRLEAWTRYRAVPGRAHHWHCGCLMQRTGSSLAAASGPAVPGLAPDGGIRTRGIGPLLCWDRATSVLGLGCFCTWIGPLLHWDWAASVAGSSSASVVICALRRCLLLYSVAGSSCRPSLAISRPRRRSLRRPPTHTGHGPRAERAGGAVRNPPR